VRLATSGYVLRRCARRRRAALAWARSAAQAWGSAAQWAGADVAMHRTFSARRQALCADKQIERRTQLMLAPPRLEGAPPVLREVRIDGAKRDLCGQDGGESTRDPGIAVAGLNDAANGGRLVRVRDAPEVP
jgi:hypothetical protein